MQKERLKVVLQREIIVNLGFITKYHRQETLVSHRFGNWKVQDQGASRSGVLRGTLLYMYAAFFSLVLTWWRKRELGLFLFEPITKRNGLVRATVLLTRSTAHCQS